MKAVGLENLKYEYQLMFTTGYRLVSSILVAIHLLLLIAIITTTSVALKRLSQKRNFFEPDFGIRTGPRPMMAKA